jgi:hypothetical protein
VGTTPGIGDLGMMVEVEVEAVAVAIDIDTEAFVSPADVDVFSSFFEVGEPISVESGPLETMDIEVRTIGPSKEVLRVVRCSPSDIEMRGAAFVGEWEPTDDFFVEVADGLGVTGLLDK